MTMTTQELAKLALTAKRAYVGTTEEEADAAVSALVSEIERQKQEIERLQGKLSDAGWARDIATQEHYSRRGIDGW